MNTDRSFPNPPEPGGGSTGAPFASAPPTGKVVLANYPTYQEAQRAVDFLSDEKFPVENLTIVGSGLRLVETITGRLNLGRAALTGLAAGAWFGFLVALFIAIFAEETSLLAILLWGLVWGAIAGAIFGAIMYAMSGGQRDFVSRQALLADRYEVMVDPQHADTARMTLGRMR